MTQAAIFEAIRERFKTQVSDELALVTVHDNAPAPEVASSWCRFSIQIDTNLQVGTGNATSRRFRCTGMAVAQVFVPQAQGDAAALEVADAIVAAFRGVSIAPQITFLGTGIIGTAEQDAAWCRRRVHIQFRADTVGVEAVS